MQDRRLALVPLIAPASTAPVRVEPARLHPAVGLAGALAIGSFLIGLPVLSACAIVAGGVAVATINAVRSRAPERVVLPEEIATLELRDAYRKVLHALADVQRGLAASPRLRSSMAPVLERSRAAVSLCGRLALLAGPVQRYLDLQDPQRIRSEAARLRERAEAADDEAAAAAWGHARAARERQLATYDRLRASRERILARLELTAAALDSFSAMIVRLQLESEEHFLLAGESVAEHLDGIGGELSALESALAADLPTELAA